LTLTFVIYIADMHRAWGSIDDTGSNWFIKKNHYFSWALQVLFI